MIISFTGLSSDMCHRKDPITRVSYYPFLPENAWFTRSEWQADFVGCETIVNSVHTTFQFPIFANLMKKMRHIHLRVQLCFVPHASATADDILIRVFLCSYDRYGSVPESSVYALNDSFVSWRVIDSSPWIVGSLIIHKINECRFQRSRPRVCGNIVMFDVVHGQYTIDDDLYQIIHHGMSRCRSKKVLRRHSYLFDNKKGFIVFLESTIEYSGFIVHIRICC